MTHLLILLFLISPLNSHPGIQSRTITGHCHSAMTGKPLRGVKVSLEETSIETKTNKFGEYSIIVPAEGGRLIFMHAGYPTMEINIGKVDKIDIALTKGL